VQVQLHETRHKKRSILTRKTRLPVISCVKIIKTISLLLQSMQVQLKRYWQREVQHAVAAPRSWQREVQHTNEEEAPARHAGLKAGGVKMPQLALVCQEHLYAKP
jgi:hypothetical protein